VSYTHFREVDSDIWWDDANGEVHTGFDHNYIPGLPGVLYETEWKHDDNQATTYGRDALDRVDSVTYRGGTGSTGTFNLDALGNREDRDSGDYFGNDPNFVDDYTVNDENEYTAIQNNAPPPTGTLNPVYDNNGNMQTFQSVPGRGSRAGLRSTVNAVYDAYNRPYHMDVIEPGGLNEDYRYGPTGLLFQFMETMAFITEGRRYIYDGGRIVAEYVFDDDVLVTDPNPPMRLDRTHIHGEPVRCAVDGNGDRDLQDNRNHLQWDDYPSGPAPADRLPIDFEWYYAPSHANGAIYALIVEDEEEAPGGPTMRSAETTPKRTPPSWYTTLSPFTTSTTRTRGATTLTTTTNNTKVLEYYIYSPDTIQVSPPYQEVSPSLATGEESTPWTLADNNNRDQAQRLVDGAYARYTSQTRESGSAYISMSFGPVPVSADCEGYECERVKRWLQLQKRRGMDDLPGPRRELHRYRKCCPGQPVPEWPKFDPAVFDDVYTRYKNNPGKNDPVNDAVRDGKLSGGCAKASC
jgi:hypothetical protein